MSRSTYSLSGRARPVRSRAVVRAALLALALGAAHATACGGGGDARARISPPDSTPDTTSDPARATPRVTLDPGTRYQTIVGWEATAQTGQDEVQFVDRCSAAVLDRAVSDLGIKRLRLTLRSGAVTSSSRIRTAMRSSRR